MSLPPKTYQAGTLTYTKGALAVLFFWLLWGDFCFVLMEAAVPSLVPIKFADLGAPKTLIGAVTISVANIMVMVFNPIISVRSDRFRSRWGRRIPFIVASMPFLVACLIGLAFVDNLGGWLRGLGAVERAWDWLHGVAPAYFQEFSPTAAVLVVMCVLVTAFGFFNIFVNSVFWYLFNDVVPEHLLARFISWFRVVSYGSTALYNLFILQHARSHYTEIFIGAGVLYFIGFGVMCFKVREGKYPPPPPLDGGKTGVVAAVKTYAKECLGVRHYWFLFLAVMSVALTAATWGFSALYQLELGLTLRQVGIMSTAGGLTSVLIMPAIGWLADRFHPIRIVLCGLLLQIFVAPVGIIWIFWQPDPQVIFYVQIAIGVCMGAPAGCLVAMMDPPLFMRIYPRSRYGQFCSASAMMRAFALILAGTMIGVYLDVLTKYFGQRVAYCCMGVWSGVAYAIALVAIIGLYRSWQKHGGDQTYVPPLPAGEAPEQT
ncbi:MAG: MFS transporter [Verrucomicrobiales bacterium]|jgi:MFS family permease|nr:MFS transporter [Verrucomicrobiales bacterium]